MDRLSEPRPDPQDERPRTAALAAPESEREAAACRAAYTMELIQSGLDQLDGGYTVEVADLSAHVHALIAEVEAEFA